MTKRDRSAATLPPLDGDGPPHVQRAAIKLGDILIRDPIVERTEWKDPEDTSSRARNHGAKPIQGWRRVWVIQRLHETSPREITQAHVKAAERLLGDYERGVDGACQGGFANDRVDASSADPTTDAQLDALERYREAVAILGGQGGLIVTVVVVDNWPIVRLAAYLGVHRDRAFGRLQAGLERLREHYTPIRQTPAVRAVSAALEPLELAGCYDLPSERIGRWRAPQRAHGAGST